MSTGAVPDMSERETFDGVVRPDGSVGVRDRVLVLPSVICSHFVADRVADRVPDAVSAPHDHGCAQLGADNEQTRRTFLGLVRNPNVAGTLIVGLGCEEIQSDALAADVAALDRPVREVSIQDAGGTDECLATGVEAAEELAAARDHRRRPADLGDLTLGVVASDLDPGTVERAAPLVGELAATVREAGGRVVAAGVEPLLAHPEAAHERVADDARGNLDAMFDRHADRPPRSVRTAGRAADLDFATATTAWGGDSVDEVLAYGEVASPDSTLAVVDAPADFAEATTALAAAGASVVVHITEDGIPAGHPLVPVVKVTGSADTAAALPDDVDVDATRAEPIALRERVLAVADGERACAERHGLTSFAITRVGPST